MLLFSHPLLVKVGFSFSESDLKMLRGCHPEYFTFANSVESLLEISSFSLNSFRTPFPSANGTGSSLSWLSEAWLNKGINKSERLSNWELRPLSKSQQDYAALDAHCLLAILESMLLAYCKIKTEEVIILQRYLTTEQLLLVSNLKWQSPDKQELSGFDFIISSKSGKKNGRDWNERRSDNSSGNLETSVEQEIKLQSFVWEQLNKKAQQRVYLLRVPSNLEDDGVVSESLMSILHPKCAFVQPWITNGIATSKAEIKTDEFVTLLLPSFVPSSSRWLPTKTIIVIITSPELEGTATETSSCGILAVVLAESHTVDFRKLSVLLNIKRRRLRLATPEECVSLTGFNPGEIPAVGLPQSVSILLDTTLSTSVLQLMVLATPACLRNTGSGLILVLTLSELNFFFDRAKMADCSKRSEERVDHPSVVITSAEVMTTEEFSSCPSSDAKAAALQSSMVRSSEVRILCDAMLLKLGRWLRVLGCDVVIFKEGGDRDTLIQAAAEDSRILLTKDRRRASHASQSTKTSLMRSSMLRLTGAGMQAGVHAAEVAVILVEGVHTQTQLAEVLWPSTLVRNIRSVFIAYFNILQVTELLGMKYLKEDFMTRCSTCNGQGFRDADAVEVRASGVAVERVLSKVTQFWACTTCGKFYWEGPKFSSAKKLLEKFTSLSLSK